MDTLEKRGCRLISTGVYGAIGGNSITLKIVIHILNRNLLSGPMRPQEFKNTERHIDSKTRVLIIGEQTARPKEVMPYIDHVLGMSGVEITIKFRDFRDGFERWFLSKRHSK